MLLGTLFLWCSRKQSVTTQSAIEAENAALSVLESELVWLQRIFVETKLQWYGEKNKVYVDNQNHTTATTNSFLSRNSEHLDTKFHLDRKDLKNGSISLQ